nr:RluA family pseudouridine synthase [Thermoanaerobaculia bacterium]
HRLDRGTSGLLLFAANPAAHAPLARAWREGQVERRYLAVVEGCPAFEELRVEAPIARSADGAWRFEARADGKPARTEVRVVVRGEQESLLACRLSTGRTHQVRVHLASVGHPVVGDRLYGAREGSAGRPLLHAAEISLPHPKTGEPLRVSSPLPPEMAERLPAGSGLGLVQ